jgi:hypothetical protein
MRYIILVAACAMLCLSACRYSVNRSIRGNGNSATRNHSVGSFTKVDVSGPFDVFVSQGTTASVRVEADENLQEYIEVRVAGDGLNIDTRDHVNLRPRSAIRVYITSPVYNGLSVTGSGDLKSNSRLTSDHLSLNVTGSGDMAVEVDAPVVNSEITGSGSISIRGATRSLDAEVNGSGEVHAFDLLSENTTIAISGSGDAEVFASKQLKINVAGSGDVRYKGSASVNQSVAGSGNVRKVN